MKNIVGIGKVITPFNPSKKGAVIMIKNILMD